MPIFVALAGVLSQLFRVLHVKTRCLSQRLYGSTTKTSLQRQLIEHAASPLAACRFNAVAPWGAASFAQQRLQRASRAPLQKPISVAEFQS